MPTRIRTSLAVDAERRTREQCARLGGEVKAGRISKRLTQQQLGARVGLARQSISRAERGHGAGLTLDAWQRIGLAVDRPLVVMLQRNVAGETSDAGHLAMQELALRLGRAAGYGLSFELATRPSEPWRSADVGLEDPAAPPAHSRRMLEHDRGRRGRFAIQRPEAGGGRGPRDGALGR